MGCSAQEMVDAIITAGELRGADGRGEDGLDGYMSMLASTSLRAPRKIAATDRAPQDCRRMIPVCSRSDS
jgi:hypothetical protein